MKTQEDLLKSKNDYISLIGKTVVEKGKNYKMVITGVSILPEAGYLVVEPNKDYFVPGAENDVYIVVSAGYILQIKARVDAFFEMFDVLD